MFSKKYLIWPLILFTIGFFIVMIYMPVFFYIKKESVFNIAKGEGSRDIALNLEKEGLIKWAPIFRLYVIIVGISGKLQAGTYLLSPRMNMAQIAEKMAKGDIVKTKVTIPEGFTLSQIEAELGSAFEGKNLNPQLKAKNLGFYKQDYDFLNDASDKAGLEGYLFPDTYWFSYGITEDDIVRAMLENLSQKLTPDLRKEIRDQNKTIFETMTMASLLEREINTMEDRKMVSGILWKRIREGIPLQVDATIIYVTGKTNERVLIKDTQIDSPYNTYKYRGLPAGPIGSPGFESIMAAIYPTESPYFYYLSDSAGKTIFSKTLKEHNLAKAKYLNY